MFFKQTWCSSPPCIGWKSSWYFRPIAKSMKCRCNITSWSCNKITTVVLLKVAFLNHFQEPTNHIFFCFLTLDFFFHLRINAKSIMLKNSDSKATLIQLQPPSHQSISPKLSNNMGSSLLWRSKLIIQNSL